MILLKQAHIFRVISVILDAERGVAYGSINIACVGVLQEKKYIFTYVVQESTSDARKKKVISVISSDSPAPYTSSQTSELRNTQEGGRADTHQGTAHCKEM